MVASNKSPVKWQHQQLAQEGRGERDEGRRVGREGRSLAYARREESERGARRGDNGGPRRGKHGGEKEMQEADSSHVRLDSRRQNVNLALTHYARSGCVALGVRYRQQQPVYAPSIALMRVGRVADDIRIREGRVSVALISRK